ncbi:hypothetical protein [Pararobbsia alpina]|uniref:hypothetical protein n=1 Tax=Pararobbsia alpina TaxID=621374 RepID=UPI0039A6C816
MDFIRSFAAFKAKARRETVVIESRDALYQPADGALRMVLKEQTSPGISEHDEITADHYKQRLDYLLGELEISIDAVIALPAGSRGQIDMKRIEADLRQIADRVAVVE